MIGFYWEIAYHKGMGIFREYSANFWIRKEGAFMPGWILRWILNILAIMFTAALLSGFEVSIWGAIVGSVFLGVINAVIRPLLIILTLPLNILTLGLFTFVVNGFMLYLTSATVKGFNIDGFWWAVLTSIVLSLMSLVISFFVKDTSFKMR
jgi:putative membrane protein